jgi:hypothetical protein
LNGFAEVKYHWRFNNDAVIKIQIIL